MQNKQEQPGLERLIEMLRLLLAGYPIKSKKVNAMKVAYRHCLDMARMYFDKERMLTGTWDDETYVYFTAVYIGETSGLYTSGTCYKLRMPKIGGMKVSNDAGGLCVYNSISAFLHDWKDISALTEDKDRY